MVDIRRQEGLVVRVWCGERTARVDEVTATQSNEVEGDRTDNERQEQRRKVAADGADGSGFGYHRG